MNGAGNLSLAHRVAWLAAGLRRAASSLGVDLPVDYSRAVAVAVAVDGLGDCEQLGVTRVGNAVAIHTAPDSASQPPILLGYADHQGQWYRDGRRHPRPPAFAPTPPQRRAIDL